VSIPEPPADELDMAGGSSFRLFCQRNVLEQGHALGQERAIALE
jgi:hypothetical protein